MTIYLYIKQCNHCQLKYFGKTEQHPYKYKGSGKLWLNHIKKHKSKIKTLEVFSFENQEEATSFALQFSEYNCIVKSNIWANLKEENALDGNPKGVNLNNSGKNNPNYGKIPWNKGIKFMTGKNHPMFNKHHSQQTKDIISSKNKGKIRTENYRKKVSEMVKGKNNPNYNSTKYKFFHKDYGINECTKYELRIKYHEQNLQNGDLTKIINGRISPHKGWTIIH